MQNQATSTAQATTPRPSQAKLAAVVEAAYILDAIRR
jgi:hypothetical protein